MDLPGIEPVPLRWEAGVTAWAMARPHKTHLLLGHHSPTQWLDENFENSRHDHCGTWLCCLHEMCCNSHYVSCETHRRTCLCYSVWTPALNATWKL
jgi:hypothetical protein